MASLGKKLNVLVAIDEKCVQGLLRSLELVAIALRLFCPAPWFVLIFYDPNHVRFLSFHLFADLLGVAHSDELTNAIDTIYYRALAAEFRSSWYIVAAQGSTTVPRPMWPLWPRSTGHPGH